MSYAIYKTDAIVLRTIPDREASHDVVFLTRDLGKITARAQGSRKPESKMRMHITRYNHVAIDVVRGAHIWRLTGINQVAAHDLFADNELLHAFHRAAMLAEHLIRGEDPHPELFDFFTGLLGFIDTIAPGPQSALPPASAFLTHPRSVGAVPPGDSFESASRERTPGLLPLSEISQGLELFAVIKVLEHLGYWQGESFPEIPTDELLRTCAEQKTQLVAMINEGIKATQIV